MKTFCHSLSRLLLTATIGLTAAVAAQAQPNTEPRPQPVCIDQVGDFSYLVRVSNPALERGELRLVRQSNGAVVYQHHSRGLNFGQRLNVRNLPDGQYAFVVKLGSKTYNYTLDIHSSYNRASRLGSVSTLALVSN